MTPPFKTHALLDIDGITHGFFGRKGGVSTGAYESLNAGQGSGDAPASITANRARICHALGAHHLVSLNQIHSRNVVIAKNALDQHAPADGIVTTQRGIALSALSADCGPVLLADTKAGVIGACHAGWRGAVSGITEATVRSMCEHGAAPADITAVLGPCISQRHYEVGEDFKANVTAQDADYERFFAAAPKGAVSTKPHFDLKAFILDRLRASGVERIAALDDCTYGDPSRYFSYRFNCHNGISHYGRNISAIMLDK